MWVLALLAAAGLVVSLAVHVSTFFGLDVQESYHWIWLLHVGAIAICFPAAILQRHAGPGVRDNRKRSFSGFCPFAPRWMQRLLPIFFIYAFVNFGIFMVREAWAGSGQAYREADGTYAVHRRGKPSQKVSEQEYHRRNDLMLRGFSGHWMLFYGLGMATLTSVAIARGSSDQQRPDWLKPAPPRASDLETMLRPRGLLPIWVHMIGHVLAQMVGFLAPPLVIGVFVLRPLWKGIGCFAMIPFFASALVGLGIAGWLYRQRVSARCPQCGGRAYLLRASNYHCVDCDADISAPNFNA